LVVDFGKNEADREPPESWAAFLIVDLAFGLTKSAIDNRQLKIGNHKSKISNNPWTP
jgi:hypothetical protein